MQDILMMRLIFTWYSYSSYSIICRYFVVCQKNPTKPLTKPRLFLQALIYLVRIFKFIFPDFKEELKCRIERNISFFRNEMN